MTWGSYNADERNALLKALSDCPGDPTRAIDRCEREAELFLSLVEDAKSLPTRVALASGAKKQRKALSDTIDAVARMSPLASNPELLAYARERPTGPRERFEAGARSLARSEEELLAAATLWFLRTRALPLESKLPIFATDDRTKKHRRSFIEGVLAAWLEATATELADLAFNENSDAAIEAAGAAAFAFVTAAISRPLALAEQGVGDRRLRKIVAEIRRAPSETLSMMLSSWEILGADQLRLSTLPPDRRLSMLVDAIEKAESITHFAVVCQRVRQQHQITSHRQPEKKRLIDSAGLACMEEALERRLKSDEAYGKIVPPAGDRWVFKAWSDLVGLEHTKRWVSAATGKSLLGFIDVCVQRGPLHGGQHILVDGAGDWFDTREMTSKAENIARSGNPAAQAIANRFLDALREPR